MLYRSRRTVSVTVQPIWAVTPEKIQEAVRRIVESTHPLKVIVFGSQARGKIGLESDLDLMVVMNQVFDPIRESVRLRRLLKGLIMAVDVLVVDRAKFEYWANTPGNVYYEAAQEGKRVYEAE